MTIRTFELFCGAGGSSCGARQAGSEIIGGIDMWKTAAANFRLNFPSAIVYDQPLQSLSAKTVATRIGRVDLLLASPECTNHSVAKGNVPRDEVSRRTAFEVVRFAKAWRPRWLVVENVVSMRNWNAYGEWMTCLKRLGYNIRELSLNSEDFGVPQSRRRLFVIADLKREPIEPNVNRRKTVPVESILDLGSMGEKYNYGVRPLVRKGRAKPTLERAERAFQAIGKNKPFLIVYYGSDAAGGWQTIDRPLRTITTLDRFALVIPGAKGHQMRMLQPPELAAAMGFPVDYSWAATTRREHIKLIGNAVSPPVMRSIVKALIS